MRSNVFVLPHTVVGIWVLLAVLPASGAFAQSHCLAEEDIVFSCALQRTSKLVSVCASKNLIDTDQQVREDAYLVYRFGKRGRVEFVFPKHRKESVHKFVFSHYFRSDTDRTELSFQSGPYTYRIFDNHDAKVSPSSSSGVSFVTTGSSRPTELVCGKTKEAQWSRVENVVPCGEEDEMTGCGSLAQQKR